MNQPIFDYIEHIRGRFCNMVGTKLKILAVVTLFANGFGIGMGIFSRIVLKFTKVVQDINQPAITDLFGTFGSFQFLFAAIIAMVWSGFILSIYLFFKKKF